MNLKTELLQTLTNLGVTEGEVAMLADRMMSAVTRLQAQLTALDTQIATLNAQREAVVAELSSANVTVQKLVN